MGEISKRMVGNKYNHYEVKSVYRKNGKTYAVCQCDCLKMGEETKDAYQVRVGLAKQCSKCRVKIFPASEDMVGETFGKLTILSVVGTIKSRPMVKCRCQCTPDKHKIVLREAYGVRKGHIVSCGCVQIASRVNAHRVHGLSKDKLYQRILSIIYRCTNPNSTSYSYYGAKGVSVYQPWIDNPVEMYNYVVKEFPNYKEEMELGKELDKDKEGNGKGYYPGTLSFLTRDENCAYKTSTCYIEAFGERLYVSLMIKKYGNGISRDSFQQRLAVGWNTERALMEPTIRGKRKTDVPNWDKPPTKEEIDSYLLNRTNYKDRGHVHQQVIVNGISVDRGLEKLIIPLWKLGYETTQSCQNLDKKGDVWIEFKDKDNINRFINSVLSNCDIDYRIKGNSVYFCTSQKTKISTELAVQVQIQKDN